MSCLKFMKFPKYIKQTKSQVHFVLLMPDWCICKSKARDLTKRSCHRCNISRPFDQLKFCVFDLYRIIVQYSGWITERWNIHIHIHMGFVFRPCHRRHFLPFTNIHFSQYNLRSFFSHVDLFKTRCSDM